MAKSNKLQVLRSSKGVLVTCHFQFSLINETLPQDLLMKYASHVNNPSDKQRK